MSIGDYKFKAGGITSMWAGGMRTAAIWRATDWDGQNGTFEEYTNNGGGPRMSLVEEQEDYTYSDNNTQVGYAYMAKLHEPTGMESDFANVAVMGDSPAATIMQAQKVAVRWVHPTEPLKGTWKEFNPNQVNITEEQFRAKGNRPYVSGTDYWLELALLYEYPAGTYEGINLTGVTEMVLSIRARGTLIDERKLGESKIEVLDQSTAHSAGGTEGHVLVKWAASDVLTVGNGYQVDLETTDATKKIAQFAGAFDVLEVG
jgi:hypothetical protein